jgi:CelD/BcsL family acetyltransferase involved in cellulose biosynthesis
MKIDLIDNKNRFDTLRDNWNDIYAADSQATVFYSWSWLRAWIEASMNRWVLMGVRAGNSKQYVGFLIVYRAANNDRLLLLGGVPESDHTAMVCAPGYENIVIETLAEYIQAHLKWDYFKLTEVFDYRLSLLVDRFSVPNYLIVEKQQTPCPYLELPSDWNSYLEINLSSSQRRKLRRAINKVEQDKRYTIELPTRATIDQYAELIIALWKKRWQREDQRLFRFFDHVIHYCFADGTLHGLMIWDGDTPVAAQLAFVDRKHNTLSFYNGGWDNAYAKLSPIIVMLSYNIRFAIENGYQACDFLRGADEYKLKFCASNRYNRNYVITRNTLKRKVHHRFAKIKKKIRASLP